MRRPFRHRVTWILCFGLVCAAFLGVGSMKAWAQGPPPDVPPVAVPPAWSAAPKEPKVRPKPKKPKKVKEPVLPAPAPPPAPIAPAPAPPPPPTPAPSPVSPKPEPPPLSSLPRPTGPGGYSPRSPNRYRAATTTNTVSPRAVARATQGGPTVLRLKVVRSWISRSGPRAQRQTTFVFHLSRPGIVEFVLTRLAPDCRVVGKFRVAGNAGLNRVMFRGRIGGRVLRAGTYRVTARTLRAATPLRVHLVVVGRPSPRPTDLAAARAANACVRVETQESVTVEGTIAPVPPPSASASVSEPKTVFKRVSGVLGTQFTKAVETVQRIPTFLFFVLGLAIALLALAALPGRAAPSARLHKVLAYHRDLIALAGTVTLIAAAISYVVW